MIYESEDGLDIRFASFGVSGQGTYFADNSQYSHTYAYSTSEGGNKTIYQMFVCFVLPGETVQDPQNKKKLRIPPFKNKEENVRYDSVGQLNGSHTIVYSNAKSYPAYLVSYELLWANTAEGYNIRVQTQEAPSKYNELSSSLTSDSYLLSTKITTN